ncbi:MAG: lipid kinase YegS [Myxococcales bacterium]|nr:lipid kinase YegS [Deltaproteobacteria bacterium]NNE18981.1 lipid kinase YegS [Myxococcales bacterium]
MMARKSRIILHGKQAANQELRDAVAAVREDGHQIEVRVTWEAGDAGLFAAQAAKEGVDTVIAGGGDGTVNEVLNGLVQVEGGSSALGVIPLGTANDFARSAGIPLQLEGALRVAVETEPVAVDVGRSGDRAFMNVATGGFGTEVTVNTNPKLKRLLGGAAYFITGLGRFSELEPVPIRLRGPDLDWEGKLLVLAVGNARQAGGGHVLCPDAVLDDGLLDIGVLPDVPEDQQSEAISALMTHGMQAVKDAALYWRVPWVEIEAPKGIYVNLDGEPTHATHHRFEVEPRRLKLHLPESTSLLTSSEHGSK